MLFAVVLCASTKNDDQSEKVNYYVVTTGQASVLQLKYLIVVQYYY